MAALRHLRPPRNHSFPLPPSAEIGEDYGGVEAIVEQACSRAAAAWEAISTGSPATPRRTPGCGSARSSPRSEASTTSRRLVGQGALNSRPCKRRCRPGASHASAPETERQAPGGEVDAGDKARKEMTSALPACLAQTLDQMGVVFRPKPRDAVVDVHVEGRRSVRNGLLKPFLSFRFASQLTQRGGRPAIDHREIWVRPDQPFRRLDHAFVLSGEIKSAGNMQ